jgi:trans-aconitate 2-methyltransferase
VTPPPGAREWDAGSYDAVAVPHLEWAVGILDRLELRGDETVLDAGCGTGGVTEMLVERLPRGRVIGVDGSRAMLEEASKRLGPGVELIHCDLLELELPEPVDAIFSSAVFHWIKDHARLFARLHEALAPGGHLEAQCGGIGNVAAFYAAIEVAAAADPFRRHLEGFEPNRFAAPDETEELLRAAGFGSARAWLQEWPVRPPEPREFIRTVCLGAHSDQLPEELRDSFLDRVVELIGRDPVLGYVRLNISARRDPTA